MPHEVIHEIGMLRTMLAHDIDRQGPTHSFMVRAGLLADLLDELSAHRLAHSTPATEDYRRGVEDAAKACDAEAEIADAQVRHYDSYGGPELPGRKAEIHRASSARVCAAAIRALPESST